MHAEHLVNELVNYHCPTRRRKRNQSDASDWFRLRLKSSASEWFHNLPRRRRLIPQTYFHTKTRSRKHFLIKKHYPANIFFKAKPYPTNTFSLKTPIPQTRFSLKAVSRKPFLFQNPIPQILFPANPYPAQE